MSDVISVYKTIDSAMNRDFETKLFKGFVVPGVIAEVVLVLNLFLPDSISLYGAPLLKYHIGGPAGMAVGMTTLPAWLIFLLFLMVAGVYACILSTSYLKKSPRFVPRARFFLIFCDVAFALMTVAMTYYMTVALIAEYLNVFVSGVVYLTMCAAFGFFIHWTRKVYRHEGLRFWSKTTLESVGKAVGFILLGIVAVQALLFL